MDYLDVIPGLHLSDVARRAFLRLSNVPHFSTQWRRDVEAAVGGRNAWVDSYGLLSLSKLRFYGESMRGVMETARPWNDLGFRSSGRSAGRR